MNENKTQHTNNSSANRHFDWGPPGNTTADGAKEWLVYLIILVCLGAGTWILLDINGQKPPAPLPSATKQATSVSAPETVEKSTSVAPQTDYVGRHYVQLGAFEDGDAAREIFKQLDQDGFKPTLAEPDHQFEFYRVFVGPFASEAEAAEISMQLNELEFHCFVIQY